METTAQSTVHDFKQIQKLKTVKYRVIHKSVKHLKNLQQVDYATDHGNSYADRERYSPSFFYLYV
jgi:hypothetical protein